MNLNSAVVFEPQLYRVLHDIELPTGIRSTAPTPEVALPPLNANRTPFGADWQKLSFAMNPGMDGNHWRVLYEWDTAFMNGTGFNIPNSPRADFVNSRDLTAPLPAWDKTRVCGGAVVTGTEQAGYLIVDVLDGSGPAPDLLWLLARPWYYFDAVIVYQDGHIGPFPQNGGQRIHVPLVGSGLARYALSSLEKLVPGTPIPDPYHIYK